MFNSSLDSIVSTLILLGATGLAFTQSSASYRLEESVMNAGGVPADGLAVTSAGFRVTLAAIGEGVAGGTTPTSASFAVGSGFPAAYPPATEVLGLNFQTDQTLSWAAEPSAGTYNLYRDDLTSLAGLGYGACFAQDVSGTTATDAALPASGAGFFYLVTAENRLDEEGTKGLDSSGTGRAGTACP